MLLGVSINYRFDTILAMILLDEQLTGLAPFLRSLGWEVETVNEIGLLGASDQKILEYITLNSLILVTEDTQLAQLAELNNQEHVWINSSKIARLVDLELRKKVKK